MIFKSFGFLLLLLILVYIPTFHSQNKDKSSYNEILLTEIKRHPHSKVEDIYKFIHQAAFGSEHAVKDTIAVRKWMENEISGLDNSINEDIIDYLNMAKKLVRVNLRPYLRKGNDPNLLLDAFIKTANNFKGSVEDFNLFWKAAEKLVKAKKFTFTVKELNVFFQEQSKNGFPPVHHSKKYEFKYEPAYRVVDLQYLQFLLK